MADQKSTLAIIRFTWRAPASSKVFVTGTFDNWSVSVPLHFDEAVNAHVGSVNSIRPLDRVVYKFVVDGVWEYDRSKPTETDANGNINNFVQVPGEEELLNKSKSNGRPASKAAATTSEKAPSSPSQTPKAETKPAAPASTPAAVAEVRKTEKSEKSSKSDSAKSSNNDLSEKKDTPVLIRKVSSLLRLGRNKSESAEK